MDNKRNHTIRKSVHKFILLYAIVFLLVGLIFSTGIASAENGRVPKEPPVVLSYTPEDGATQIPINSAISVIWDRPMQPDTNFSVTGPEGFVPGTFLYDPDTFTVTFLPDQGLAPDTRYGVLVTGQVGMNGLVQRETYQWNFSTVTPTSVSVVSFGPTDEGLGQSWLWSSWPWLMAAISIISLAGFLFLWHRRRLVDPSRQQL